MTKGLQLVAGTSPIHLATGNITLLQCACSSGTSMQSQSLGHANRAVACCSHLFVVLLQWPKHWEVGVTAMNCFTIRVWHWVDGSSGVLVEHPRVWEDEQQGI